MTYEVNESHFFSVSGISQIKTFSYMLTNQVYNGEKYQADIGLNLTYFDQELQEKFVNLTFPLELVIENYRDDCFELKNVNLLVIENQGVKLEFDLEILLADEIHLQEANPTDAMPVEEVNLEVEKEMVKESYQQTLEENMLKENNIKLNNQVERFSINDLKTSFHQYRVLFVDEDAKINQYSNQYAVSMDELYKAKKNNQRLIVDADGKF